MDSASSRKASLEARRAARATRRRRTEVIHVPSPPPVLRVAELRVIGEALYGNMWQTDLAAALNYDKSLLSRIVAGHRPMAPELAFRLREVIKKRLLEVAEVFSTRGLPLADADVTASAIDLVHAAVGEAAEAQLLEAPPVAA